MRDSRYEDRFDEDTDEKELRRARHARRFRPMKPERPGRSSKADVRQAEERIIRREFDREIKDAFTDAPTDTITE